MPRQLGPITETLMRRIRQQGGLAVNPDFALEVYSRCEQVTNTFTKRVLSSTTLNVAKEKLLIHYRDVTEGVSDAIDIVSIRESGRRIEKVDHLSKLSAYDIDFFRNITGTRFEAWCQIGRDLLVLYPGQAAASSVDIEYVKLLTLKTDFDADYNTDSELPSEDIELALKLAEVVLLTRFRQINEANILLKAITSKLFPSQVKQ